MTRWAVISPIRTARDSCEARAGQLSFLDYAHVPIQRMTGPSLILRAIAGRPKAAYLPTEMRPSL